MAPSVPLSALKSMTGKAPANGEDSDTGETTVSPPVAPAFKNPGQRNTANLAYSDAARRKALQRPQDGVMIRISNVFDILKQVRLFVGMVANVWSWTNSTSSSYAQAMPGLVRVHMRSDVFVVPYYLMSDLESSCVGHVGMSSTSVQDMYLKIHTLYFHEVILLLKLRWLLRLHSACCELDYKMCSLKNIIMGLQYISLQQVAEAESDNIFDTKVIQQVAEVNLDSVLDDIMDQVNRALGKSSRSFIDYVRTCDPTCCVNKSQMDSSLTPVQVVRNDMLAVALDTAFLTHFLRTSRRDRASRLRELYDDLDLLGIPLPDVPPLAGAQNLRAWSRAHSRPTRSDREKASKAEFEKLAQLDAILLTLAIELHSPEVLASPEEMAPSEAVAHTQTLPKVAARDTAPEPTASDNEGRAAGSVCPPAARVILYDKPQLSPVLFEAAVDCVHHHLTFPQGIRERLCGLLMEEYGLTEEQSEHLAVAATQNIDGHRLSESALLQMDHREKTRLSLYAATTAKSTSHLVIPPLVALPCEKGKPPKYLQSPPSHPRLPYASAFTSVDMTRSLPDLRGFKVRPTDRSPFKVPSGTGGPLTMDRELRKLRSTGFFIRMPPLDGGNYK